MDETEGIRRQMVEEINSSNPQDDTTSRQYWEKQYGQVWDSKELSNDFEVLGFMAPFVVCRHKETGKKGALEFSHMPRYYFNWKES